MSAPRGFLLIVGPDGAGKSTVADAIEEHATDLCANVIRTHHRPGILRPGDPSAGPVTDPHARRPWALPLAILKLLGVLLDFLLGARVWRRQARAGLLIVERGWWDMAVDPRRYRLPAWTTPAIRLIGRLTPRADVAVMLAGDPEVLAARKDEIDATETARQIHAWRRLVGTAGSRQVTVDTTAVSPDRAAELVLEELRRVGLRWRRVPLAARRLGLRAAGRAAPAFVVHRPFAPAARVGASVGRALYRLGATTRCPAPIPGLEELLAELGIRTDGLVAFRSSARDRWVVGIADAGTLGSVAKIGPTDDEGLRNETDTLQRLHERTDGFDVPQVRDARVWRDRYVLLTDARRFGHHEPSVEEAVAIATELTVGVDGVGPLVHGDLAPWNLHRARDTGRLVVVDWEQARPERAPLHDLAHYVVRAGALLAEWTPAEAVRLLVSPGSPGAAHLEQVAVPSERAPELVLAYLERSVAGSQQEAAFRHQLVRALGEPPVR